MLYVCKCQKYDEDIINQFNFDIVEHDIHIKPKSDKLELLGQLFINMV